MIYDKVQNALTVAVQNKSNDISLLRILDARLKRATRSRKSGDIITDDKAADIIKNMIADIKKDHLLSHGSDIMVQKRIALLENFL